MSRAKNKSHFEKRMTLVLSFCLKTIWYQINVNSYSLFLETSCLYLGVRQYSPEVFVQNNVLLLLLH